MEADKGIVWTVVDQDSFDKDEFDARFMAGVRAGIARRKAEAKRPPPRPDYKEKLFLLTNLAIQSYNSYHQNNQFELVDPLHLQFSFTDDDDYLERTSTAGYHLSFIARSKSYKSYSKLFFAEVSSSGDTVRRCFIVEPGNPLYVAGCLSCHPDGVIYHPYEEGVCYEWDPYGDTCARPTPLSPESRHFCAKRFLSKAYTITSRPEELITEDVDELKRTAYPYAVEAIDMYNFIHASAFMALEIVACVRFRFVDNLTGQYMWAHLIFKAMHKDHNLTNASPVYFFGEVGFQMGTVTCCVMIGEKLRKYSRTETSCAVCHEHCPMFHPDEDEYSLHRDGQFADALYEDKGWAQKARLEQKDGESVLAARLEYLDELEHLQW